MVSAASYDRRPPLPVKIVVAGGLGVGKTTAVASISEIEPLTTEAQMTEVAAGVDDTGGLLPGKHLTTVAMDFGRVTIADDLRLYLFGTPGQDRFGFMWDDMCHGAVGALVVLDTRRLDDCYPALDYFERRDIPFVAGVNLFDGAPRRDLAAVRWALAVSDDIPLVAFDARERRSVRDVLLEVAATALRRAEASGAAAGRAAPVIPDRAPPSHRAGSTAAGSASSTGRPAR